MTSSKGLKGCAALRAFGVFVSVSLAFGSSPVGFASMGSATALALRDAMVRLQGRPGPYVGARNHPRPLPPGVGRTLVGRGGINTPEDFMDLARAESARYERFVQGRPELLDADSTPEPGAALFLGGGGSGDPGLGEGLGGMTAGVGFEETHEPGGGPSASSAGAPPFGSGTGISGGKGASSESGTSFNTNTGNQITTLPLVGWSGAGMTGVGFTMVHNSMYTDATGNVSDLGHSWTHSYSTEVASTGVIPPTGGDIAWLIWVDGKRIKFTYSGGWSQTLGYRFDGPTGFHAALHRKSGSGEGWTLKTKDQWTYTFHATTNKVITQKDPWGNTITINRASGNDITSVSDGLGRSLTFLYDGGGKISRVTAPDGKFWELVRNAGGDVTQVKYPALSGTVHSVYYGYNANHDVTTVTNKAGKAWSFAYDGEGKLLSLTNPLAKTWSVAYTATTTTVTNPLGGAVVHTYSAGQLVSTRDEAGYYTNLFYDAAGNVQYVRDALDKYWQWWYDAQGNVTSTVDPTGKTWQYTYDSLNKPLTTKDPGNTVVLTLEYANGSPSPTRATRPVYSPTTKINYAATGEVSSTQVDFGGGVLETTASYTYDAYKNVLSVVDQAGVASSATYDVMGRPLTVTDATGAVTTPSYDGWGRATGATLPGGSTVSVALNVLGLATSATDQLGRTGSVTYNDLGGVVSATNAKGEATSYSYDYLGRTTSVTNARGYARTFSYTARGEVYSLVQPGGATETWAYGATGSAASYTNALSQTITYAYDPAGRQTLINYPVGVDTSFGYDALGRNTWMADSTGTSSWALNVLGQVTSLSTPQGAFSYIYNNLGQPLTMVDSSGTWTTGYDSYHRAVSSTNPWGEASSVVFDSFGRVSRKNIPNGMYETYVYDVLSRMTELRTYDSGNVLRDTKSYTWDSASRVTSATEGGVTATYAYDLIDQLTSEVKSALGYSGTYTYDANGNRSTRTVNGVIETYSYDGADKLTAITGGSRPRTFGYDLAGRTTSIVESAGTTTLSYDYEGRVTSIGTIGGGTDSFTYNGAGARVSSSGTNGSKTFRRNGTGVTSPLMGDGTKTYTPGVSSRQSGVSTFDHSGLKNSTDQTSSAQSITASRHYDAFGKLISSSGTWAGIHGYAGQYGYQEDANGLKLLGHRYYDSATGRFLSQDPIKDGRNWYSYCENSPISSSDPNGLLAELAGGDRQLRKLQDYMLQHDFSEAYTNKILGGLAMEMLLYNEGTMPQRLRALLWAVDNLGNLDYDGSDGRSKCNIFIYDAYSKGANGAMPDSNPWKPFVQTYRANDFADRSLELDYFRGGGQARRGDIVAFELKGGTGHMTMKLGPGLLIYANDVYGVKLGTYAQNVVGHEPYVRRRK